MSLDATLENINHSLGEIRGLLEVVQMAIMIVAISLAILLIGTTITCYYAKYKKYNQRPRDPESSRFSDVSQFTLLTPPTSDRSQYQKGQYHPNEM